MWEGKAMFNKKTCLALAGMALVVLSACSSALTSEQIQKNKYRRLETAFNNIQQTLIRDSYLDKSLQPNKKYWYHAYDFENIFSLYTDENVIDDKPYISKSDYSILQFLLIKNFYEKVGENFEFSKIYTEQISGDVYYDFKNGVVDTEKKDENKYSCSFSISLKIIFNHYEPGDPIISSTLGGNIQNYLSVGAKFDNGSELISKNFISVNDISYSFDSDNINYNFYTTRRMFNLTDPYTEHEYLYSYDFASVEESNLKEWRRFNISSDNQVNFETTYDSAKENGMVLYPGEALRYINNSLFELKEFSDEDAETFAETMYGFHQSQNYAYPFCQEIDSKYLQTNLISQSYFELIESIK